MLFNIYTNDLTTKFIEVKKIYPQIFADDTNVLGKKMNKLQETIKIAEEWAKENEMKINKNKSKIMILNNEKKLTQWEK